MSRRKIGEPVACTSELPTSFDVYKMADYLNRTPGAIYMMVSRRQIPFRKIRGRVTFFRHEIEPWIEGHPGVSVEEAWRNGAE